MHYHTLDISNTMVEVARPSTPPRPTHSGNMPQPPMTPEQVRKMVSRIFAPSQRIFYSCFFTGRSTPQSQSIAKSTASSTITVATTAESDTVRFHSRRTSNWAEASAQCHLYLKSSTYSARCAQHAWLSGAKRISPTRHRDSSSEEVSEVCGIRL